MRRSLVHRLAPLCCTALAALPACVAPPPADLVLRNGHVVSVDEALSTHEAMAIAGGRIIGVGSDEAMLALRGPETRVVDLEGRTVIPGLIDSHVHATAACMTEFDHPIPVMEDIADVLEYVRARAETLDDGEWIVIRQVFITRLAEQRYPTRAELDAAAPRNPVLFSTGPDASVNSLALELSGIGRGFEVTDGKPGHIEKDPQTGEPTGILRSCTRLVKVEGGGRSASDAERTARLRELVADYNRVGITTVADRNAGDGAVASWRALRDDDTLSVRVFLSRSIDAQKPVEEAVADIRAVAGEDLFRDGDDRLWIGGIKVFLDGGMLTGSAYMREPWGLSRIYSITDPEYRGLLFIPRERLLPMVQAAVESGLQFTAHSVGDAAVHTLLDVYDEVNRSTPIRGTRPCLTHANFMSAEAIETMARLGVVADIQPAWLYLDTRTLAAQFGLERLRWFQPLKSLFAKGVIVGGGSDHMQKIGARRSVNPYDPFLGMWITLTRRARGFQGSLHAVEALDRNQALAFYTRNNAHLLRADDRIGSLEPGKYADFAVLDRDILSCPVDELLLTRVLETWVGGQRVRPE